MQLIIDVGNTNITSAIFKNTDIIFDFRLATDKNKSIDEYYISFNTILNSANINISEITDIVICSVVPQLDKILELSFIKYFSIKPFFINLADNLKLNIKINVHNPLEVGADRIANAEYCAVNFKEQNIIVIDFGTATTFDIILKSGIYEGGIIAPGIALSSKALFNAAAKLYPVNYEKIPNNIIGKNTNEAMVSGILYGYIAMTEGLINKIIESTSINDWLIIATGGFSNIFQKLTNRLNIIDDKITLKGTKLIFDNTKISKK